VQLLLFVITVIILLPLLIVGLIIFTYRVRRISIPQKVSGTANEPFGARLWMHAAGTRDDPVAYALAGHLPVYNKLVKFLVIETVRIACRISGYKGSVFAYPGPRPSGLATFISHRTEFFDNSVNEALTNPENPARQFVVLGAGWDTRCYDLPEDTQVKCFEIDMAPTLKAKVKGVQSAGIPHDHVTFVETDFNQRTWLDSLSNKGFDTNVTTHVLWEGVSMYLTENAVLDTLKLVATLPEGSTIAFDYFSREFIDGEPPYDNLSSKRMRQGAGYYSETLTYGISTVKPARDAVEKIVNECGLQLRHFEHTHEEETPPLYAFATAVKQSNN